MYKLTLRVLKEEKQIYDVQACIKISKQPLIPIIPSTGGSLPHQTVHDFANIIILLIQKGQHLVCWDAWSAAIAV